MIYTANIGQKDKPRTDVKCFTEPVVSEQLARKTAKRYKVLPHLYFPDQEWTVWVDANIKLNVPESDLIEMTKPYDIGVFHHAKRDCLYQEGKICIEKGLDRKEVIEEQLEAYKEAGFPQHAGLGACFIIVRRNTPEIHRLNHLWWQQIERYSIRDQISFPFVFDGLVKYFPPQQSNRNKYFTRYRHLR